MSEEQLRILKMIEEQKITAEDGAKLLGAIGTAAAARERGRQDGERGRHAGERGRHVADAWGGFEPPAPPTPPTPPGIGFDPFEFAFGRPSRIREEGRDRESRRRRRDTEPFESPNRGSAPVRQFRIKVHDPASENSMVDVRLPVGLINFGLKLAGRYIPESAGVDMAALSEAVQQGALGKIIDIQQGGEHGQGSRVEIWIE